MFYKTRPLGFVKRHTVVFPTRTANIPYTSPRYVNHRNYLDTEKPSRLEKEISITSRSETKADFPHFTMRYDANEL